MRKRLYYFYAGPEPHYSRDRISQEASKTKLEFVDVFLGDLSIQMTVNNNLLKNNELIDLRDSYVILRNLRHHKRLDDHLYNIITEICTKQGAKILNGKAYDNLPGFQDKLLTNLYLSIHGLPTIPIINFRDIETFKRYEFGQFPILVKPRSSSHGSGVAVFDNKKEINNWFNYDKRLPIENYIWQPLIKADFDLRIFASPQKVFGAIKRFNDKSFINNISAGGMANRYTIDAKMSAICLKIATVLKADLVGIDIIIDKDSQKPYILEVSLANEFKGFEQVTNINLAKIQLEILLNQTRP